LPIYLIFNVRAAVAFCKLILNGLRCHLSVQKQLVMPPDIANWNLLAYLLVEITIFLAN